MAARRLAHRFVERIWGRRDLPAAWRGGAPQSRPIGEIWFEDEDAPADLLVKYLFTSERLSIQVHPDDEAARARGHPRGKDEAWFILAAEPGAVIGLGLNRTLSADELREAASSGAIEALIDWRPVAPGEIIYSPAGTVHAIGAGLSLVEIQQNLDLTYRLYDYGRPRELHLDEAVAVAKAAPFAAAFAPYALGPGRTVAASGRAFTVERWRGGRSGRIESPEASDAVLVPLAGAAAADGASLEAGEVWSLRGSCEFSAGADADLLVAYPGPPRPAAFA